MCRGVVLIYGRIFFYCTGNRWGMQFFLVKSPTTPPNNCIIHEAPVYATF